MRELEYPFAAVNVTRPGWEVELINHIDKIEGNKIDYDNYFTNILSKSKERVYKNVDWINNN